MFERVQRIAADVFGLRPNQITLQSCPASIANWDSIQHLNLVLALEAEFGLQFEPDEIAQAKTVGEILALLEHKMERSA